MSELRPAPFFVGDDLALDFLNSVAAPWSQEIEWLANGRDLLAWLEQAHLVPDAVAARFRAQASGRALDSVALRARELREWLRGFVADHAGKPLERQALRALAPLNRLLEQDECYRQIEAALAGNEPGNDGADHPPLRWRSNRRWRSPETLLLPLADAVGDLVCKKDFALVRQCEGAGCTLWFFDASKGHARRWCSMAVCGNRAKAAAHRARVRKHQTDVAN